VNISDEAVEAGAKCHYEAELGVNWDDVRPSVKRGYIDDARRMLEAAAPYMYAQALDDAVQAFPLETIVDPDYAFVWIMRRSVVLHTNPYRSQA
jgi:hypothetical protein